MDLLEYQAKELFRQMGIPVLPSQRIDNSTDIKNLRIPYPVVLKSQVRAGGRGKAGGIRFAENTIDAIAAARTIFNLPIMGEYPKVLLAEAKYNADQEFYLAVVLDYVARRPVLLGSSQGGINVDAVMAHMQQVVVEQEFSPFYARRLMVKMGLQGPLIQSVSAIVERMYQLFIQKDLDIVEINPLGVSPTGEVMALDGKITVNDTALARHPDVVLLGKSINSNYPEKEKRFRLTSLNSVEREGNIGIICNGTGLALGSLDLLYDAGVKPAICLIVGREIIGDSTSASIQEHWEQALEQVMQLKNVKVILINVLCNEKISQEVIQGAIAFWSKKLEAIPMLLSNLPEQKTGITNTLAQTTRRSERSSKAPYASDRKWNRLFPQFVLRIVGGEIDRNQEPLNMLPIHWSDNLDEAIAQVVSLAKSAARST